MIQFLMASGNRFYKRVGDWLFATHPQGLGTLLIGVAALVALYQTQGTLEKLLRIEEQTKAIQAVLLDLDQTIKLMQNNIKLQSSIGAIQFSEVLRKDKPTREEVEKAISSFTSNTEVNWAGAHGAAYIPKKDRAETVEKLLKTTNIAERLQIIQKSLVITTEPTPEISKEKPQQRDK